jgi:hypothetical protein
MSALGFESKIAVGNQPLTYALDRATTGTGIQKLNKIILHVIMIWSTEITLMGSGINYESNNRV